MEEQIRKNQIPQVLGLLQKKIFCICFILSLSCYSISYAQYTLTPDGSYEGYDSPDSESTNNTFGQDWNNLGQ